MTNYQRCDIKYYYQIHCARQRVLGNTPVCYERFAKRLKVMNLHDAIYTPRAEGKVRDMKAKLEPTFVDKYRRRQTLNDENVRYLDFHHTKAVEEVFKKKKKNKIEIPRPKPTLRDRFISLFKKND